MWLNTQHGSVAAEYELYGIEARKGRAPHRQSIVDTSEFIRSLMMASRISSYGS